MSDGMSDANAASEMERDLTRAADKFKEALDSACRGRRGWGPSRGAIIEIVNDALRGTDFRLVRKEDAP